MRFFSSPIAFLGALLVIFGGARFTYSAAQVMAGKEEQKRVQRSRQAHLGNAAKALLLDGKASEARAMLVEAVKSGQLRHFSLRQEEILVESAGAEAPGALAEEMETAISAGPYALRLVGEWSWQQKMQPMLGGLVEDLVFLVVAAAVALGAYSQRKKRPQKKSAVRILRAGPEPKAAPAAPAPVPEQSEAFECTLLRVQIGSPDSREAALLEIMPLLEGAGKEARAVAARYAGQIVSAGGHEITCYFRDQGDGHSALLALSAARDLRSFLKHRTGKIGVQYGLAHGFARLVVQGQGGERQLLGAPFLELGRLAAEPGQILVTERVAKCASPTVKFKTRVGAIAYAQHAPLAEVLERAERGIFAELDGYHQDEHLLALLESLAEKPHEMFVGVVGQLRHFAFRGCGPEVAAAFKKLLRAELERNHTFRLSSFLALSTSFFSKDTVDQDLYACFLEALAHPERRVKSNAIEIFIHLYPEQEVPGLRACAKSTDHRISANALIKMALERFDEKIVRSLYGRVRGGSVAHVASALFALGEIALHYRAQNPNYLRTKLSFLRLFEEIPFWVKHPNTMVRRQALLAAKKLADPQLDEKLRKLHAECEDPELLALFSATLGWTKASRRSA